MLKYYKQKILIMHPLKIKNPTLNDTMDNKLSILSEGFPNLNKTLEPYLPILNNLVTTGILDKSGYDLFKDDFSNFNLYASLHMLREDYIRKYGFFLINEDFINLSADLFENQNILEVGAGSGFLSSCLKDKGLQVTAVDKAVQRNSYGFKKKYCEIIEDDAKTFLRKNKDFYDVVYMSWPDYESNFAHDVLKSMTKGQTLVYIGESYGGCTGNDLFFDLLEQKTILLEGKTQKFQKYTSCWPGVHDRVYCYQIK